MALTAESNRHGLDPAPASFEDLPRGWRLSSDNQCEPTALLDGGDREARDRMVQANLGLVAAIARHFLGRGLDYDDLIGEGNLGLIRAAQRFNSSFGTKFSTYAAFWIKEAIRCALINTTATIRVPAYMTRLRMKWRRAERILSQEAGRTPTFEEIATSLQLTDVQNFLVSQALRVGQVRLEVNYSAESGNWLADEARDERPPSDCFLESEKDWVSTARRMDRLDTRERVVLTLRFGLEGEILTRKEIGRRLGITGEGARGIELRALRKLSDDRCERTIGRFVAS